MKAGKGSDTQYKIVATKEIAENPKKSKRSPKLKKNEKLKIP